MLRANVSRLYSVQARSLAWGWKRAHSSMNATTNPISASFLRGGTSKGVFINRAHLPLDRSQWDRIFLGIMGSPDPDYGRQLNGMGGGVSSLSKICVVGAPSDDQKAQGIDVEYTFVQVGIRDSVIDYSGNCGNLSSMIGVFAIDEGLCRPGSVDEKSGTGTVRSFNTNTNKRIDTTFPILGSHTAATPVLDLAQTRVAGVPGKASQIVMEFVSPGGARTGKLLPSGNAADEFIIPLRETSFRVRASLVDATNPTVFITSGDLRSGFQLPESSPIDYSNVDVLSVLEQIRQKGAQRMGLDPTTQAQPKIAVLTRAITSKDTSEEVDVVIHALSMGVLHKAVPMTVGLCLGVASGIKGTLAWDTVQHARKSASSRDKAFVRIRHPGGLVDVGADFLSDGEVKSAKVVRTGRRLMKGVVWW